MRIKVNETDRAKFVAAIPLIGVNTVAIYGQYAFFRDHSNFPPAAAFGFAITVESIAIYLSYMAHKALLDLDTSFRLRLGSYVFGLIAGAMNLSHYSPRWHITVIGIAAGILSASSPWLWGVYSRRQSRRLLAENGLIEPGAVRLGNRWLVHPIWSVPIFRYAIWNGIRNPSEAIESYNASRQAAESEPPVIETITEPPGIETKAEPPEIEPVRFASQSDAVRHAFNALGLEASSNDVKAWLAERGTSVKDSLVRNVRKQERDKAVTARRQSVRALPSPETDTKREDA